MRFQGRSKRKHTGSKLHPYRKERKYELGRPAIETKIGPGRAKIVRVKGGNTKQKLFADRFINVYDPADKKVKRIEIQGFVENTCTIDYNRRGIITKGAIVKTELGNVVVTSRPGQHGILNGKVLE